MENDFDYLVNSKLEMLELYIEEKFIFGIVSVLEELDNIVTPLEELSSSVKNRYNVIIDKVFYTIQKYN